MSSKSHIQLKLVTPVAVVFEQAVDAVTIPTQMGEITVLPHHAALVSVLAPGELTVTAGSDTFPIAVAGGMIEVYNNNLVILADSAVHATDIDLAEAEAAAAKLAKELETETKMDLTTYSILQRNLEVERARILVANKWRKLKK